MCRINMFSCSKFPRCTLSMHRQIYENKLTIEQEKHTSKNIHTEINPHDVCLSNALGRLSLAKKNKSCLNIFDGLSDHFDVQSKRGNSKNMHICQFPYYLFLLLSTPAITSNSPSSKIDNLPLHTSQSITPPIFIYYNSNFLSNHFVAGARMQVTVAFSFHQQQSTFNPLKFFVHFVCVGYVRNCMRLLLLLQSGQHTCTHLAYEI